MLKLFGSCEQTGNANVDGAAWLIGNWICSRPTSRLVRPGDVLVDWKLNSIGESIQIFRLVGILEPGSPKNFQGEDSWRALNAL